MKQSCPIQDLSLIDYFQFTNGVLEYHHLNWAFFVLSMAYAYR